jgi:hypothetical protein
MNEVSGIVDQDDVVSLRVAAYLQSARFFAAAMVSGIPNRED